MDDPALRSGVILLSAVLASHSVWRWAQALRRTLAYLITSLFARIQANEQHVLQQLLHAPTCYKYVVRSRRQNYTLSIKTDHDDRNFITRLLYSNAPLYAHMRLWSYDHMALYKCVYYYYYYYYYTRICTHCFFLAISLLSDILYKLRLDDFLLNKDDDVAVAVAGACCRREAV